MCWYKFSIPTPHPASITPDDSRLVVVLSMCSSVTASHTGPIWGYVGSFCRVFLTPLCLPRLHDCPTHSTVPLVPAYRCVCLFEKNYGTSIISKTSLARYHSVWGLCLLASCNALLSPYASFYLSPFPGAKRKAFPLFPWRSCLQSVL